VYDCRGKINELIESYLEERDQYVEIKCNQESFKSKQLKAINGVPQGTILGPLFFSIYINDLPTFIKDYAEIVMYADDCALIVSGNDKKEVESKVNKVLNLTNNWLE